MVEKMDRECTEFLTVQWNPAISNTQGKQKLVRYRVNISEYLTTEQVSEH